MIIPGQHRSINRKDRDILNKYLYAQGVDAGGKGNYNESGVGKFLKENLANQDIAALAKKYNFADLDTRALGGLVRHTDHGYGLFARNESRRIAQEQAKNLTDNQLRNADEFKNNLPQYVAEETGNLRKSLAHQLAETRGQIRANENARGMLHSGRRQSSEGKAQNQASAQYAQGAGQIIQSADKASASMAANPLRSKANLAEAQSQQNQFLQSAQEARNQAAQNMMGSYMGMIGSGVGQYLGNRAPAKTQQQEMIMGGGSYNNYGSYT